VRALGWVFQLVGMGTAAYALYTGELVAVPVILVLLSCHRIEEAIYEMR
jgi:hypothetical protein